MSFTTLKRLSTGERIPPVEKPTNSQQLTSEAYDRLRERMEEAKSGSNEAQRIYNMKSARKQYNPNY